MCDNMRKLIGSRNTESGVQLMISKRLEHPVMKYLIVELLKAGIDQADYIQMTLLHHHLKFLKLDYEIENDVKYTDLVIIYSHAECCGHTIVVGKGIEEIRIRYNPVFRKLVFENTEMGDMVISRRI